MKDDVLSGEVFLNFGFEYGNIAASLAKGEGYANPFGEGSGGETAWQLPLVVGVFALFFKIFGVETVAASWALMLLKNVVISSVGVLAVRLMADTPFKSFRYLPVPILLFYMAINPALFDMVDDIVFVWLISLLMILSVMGLIKGQNVRWTLMILSVLVPLSAPSMTLALALLLFWAVGKHALETLRIEPDWAGRLKKFSSHHTLQTVAFCFLAFTCSVGGWAVRNYLTFHAFIPSKPNLWFEFYLANIIEKDGTLTTSTFYAHHPYTPTIPASIAYREKGEHVFLQPYAQLGKDYLRENTGEYLRKTANRFSNIFIFTNNYRSSAPANVALLTGVEMDKLEEIGLFPLFEKANGCI